MDRPDERSDARERALYLLYEAHSKGIPPAATIDLQPEYRVDGGPWLTLPDLQATATTVHQVEERQAVITKA